MLGSLLPLAVLLPLQVPPDSAPAPAPVPELELVVDPRVELLSIVYRLAGFGEFAQGRVPAYNAAVDAWFEPFREHAAVRTARELRGSMSLGFDSAMRLAVHLSPPPELEPLRPWEDGTGEAPSILGEDVRWTAETAARFVEDLRVFVQDSELDAFLAEQAELHALAVQRARELVEREVDLSWFERFFGHRPEAPFTLVLGLGNGGSNYGLAYRDPTGEEHLYAVLGVWLLDEEGLPRFDSGVVGTIVHEFVHSYANPLIDRAWGDGLAEPAAALFARSEATMRRQAYAEPRIVLYESLVRACVARYHLDRGDSEAARRSIEEDESRNGFTWLGGLVDLLGEYEEDREAWPDLDAFRPRLVAWFAEAAGAR